MAKYVVARMSTFSICWPGPTVAAERCGGKACVVGEVGVSWIAVECVSHRFRLRYGVRPDSEAVPGFNFCAGPMPLVFGPRHGEFFKRSASADVQFLSNLLQTPPPLPPLSPFPSQLPALPPHLLL